MSNDIVNIEDELPSGSYGRVFVIGNEVIKRTRVPKHVYGTLIQREIYVLNLVKNHPYFIQLKEVRKATFDVEFDEDDDPDYYEIVMQKEDKDLHTILKERKLTITEIILASLNILLGLEFMHAMKLMHLDIKPSNILIDNDNIVDPTFKLGDFGFSIPLGRNDENENGVVTSWYRSPELMFENEYDMKCDIWSFGCVLYEMIVGNVLFDFESKQEHIKAFTYNKTKIVHNMLQEVKTSFSNLKFNHENKQNILNKTVQKRPTAMSYHEEDLVYDLDKTEQLFINLLQNTISFQSKSRYTATQLINSFFYKDFKDKIDTMRRLYCDTDLNGYISKVYSFEYIIPSPDDSPNSLFQHENEPYIKCNFVYASFVDRPLPYVAKGSFESLYKKISKRHFFLGYYLFDYFLNNTNHVNSKNIQIYIQYAMYTAGKYFEIFTIPDALLYMPTLKSKELREIMDECIINFDNWIIENPLYYRNIYEDKRKANDIYKTIVSNRKYID